MRDTAMSGRVAGGRLRLPLGALALLPFATCVAGVADVADTRLLALGVAGTLLALAIIAVLFDRDVTQRVQALSAAARRLRLGELDAPVPVAGADELTDVAVALEAFRRDARAIRGGALELAARREACARLERDFDRFLELASRRLKAPLRAIGSLAGFLREDLGESLSGESRRQFELLQDRVAQLDSLLAALFDYGRAGSRTGPSEAVDLREMIDTAIGQTCPATAQVLVTGDAGRVSTWRAPLERVLCELLAHALLRNDDSHAPVAIDCELGDSDVRLAIVDNGVRIACADRERLFEPFGSRVLPDPAAGSSAGLAVVKRLVDTYGGSVAVDREPAGDRGATVVVRWPVDAVRASVGSARRARPPGVAVGRDG